MIKKIMERLQGSNWNFVFIFLLDLSLVVVGSKFLTSIKSSWFLAILFSILVAFIFFLQRKFYKLLPLAHRKAEHIQEFIDFVIFAISIIIYKLGCGRIDFFNIDFLILATLIFVLFITKIFIFRLSKIL